VATDTCANNANTDVCQTFGSGTIDFFADQDLVLDPSDAQTKRFEFDGKDRFYKNRVLTLLRPDMRVRVTLTSADFDPVLEVFDTVSGTCVDRFVTEIDDPTDAAAPERALLVTPDGSDVDLVTTTFGVVGGVDSGNFHLETRGIPCATGNAANDVTDTQNTYDICFRTLFERGANNASCDTQNPCACDANFIHIRSYCALQASVHTSGNPIVLRDDGPGSVCEQFVGQSCLP
jgi:hypothetical protein